MAEQVSINPENSGAWEDVGNGPVWRLRVHAPGAVSLSLGFSRFELPDGATLRISDSLCSGQMINNTSVDFTPLQRLLHRLAQPWSASSTR